MCESGCGIRQCLVHATVEYCTIPCPSVHVCHIREVSIPFPLPCVTVDRLQFLKLMNR